LESKRETVNDGVISKIERFAIHDGPGIRTVIFMKGCPLRCAWCSNPENQLLQEESFFKPEKEAVGRKVTVEKVMSLVLKDALYYEVSNGGITLSGGEPLYQPAFSREILKACRDQRIQTAIETCGFAPWKEWESILPMLDLIHFDLKHPDPESHSDFTGVDNHIILDNLRGIASSEVPLVIRIPLIPGYNDSPEALGGFASIMQSLNLRSLQLLPYHKMGVSKYRWLGRKYLLPELETQTETRLSEIVTFFKQKGFSAELGG
jgi:pyruvate formate lyase activating enzyme